MSVKLKNFIFDVPRLYTQGVSKCKIELKTETLDGLKDHLVQTPANIKAYDEIVDIVKGNKEVDIAEWKDIFPIGMAVLDDDNNEIIVKKEDIPSFMMEIGETHIYSNSSISVEICEGEVLFYGYEKSLAVEGLHEFIYDVSSEKEMGLVPTNLEIIIEAGGSSQAIKVKGKAEVPKLILKDKFKKHFYVEEVTQIFVEKILLDRIDTDKIIFQPDTELEALLKYKDKVEEGAAQKWFEEMCQSIRDRKNMVCTISPTVLGAVININGREVLAKFRLLANRVKNIETSTGESIELPLEFESGNIAISEEGEVFLDRKESIYEPVVLSSGEIKLRRKRFFSDAMTRVNLGDKRPIVRISGVISTPEMKTKDIYEEFFGKYNGGYEEVNLEVKTEDDLHLDTEAINSVKKIVEALGNKEVELDEILELIPPAMRASLPKNNTLAAIAFTLLHNKGVK